MTPPREVIDALNAVLFSEIEPGVVRVNLRGENGTRILEIARKLGGGGHQFSAGVRIRGGFQAVLQRALGEAVSFLGRG